LAILAILACILAPMLNKAYMRSQASCCNCNLKQIGLAFKTWAVDHTNSFPMEISTNLGGTREYAATGDVFPHFQAISNELSTPKLLNCPADSERGSVTRFDANFDNTRISYFVGVDAVSATGQMFLSGDRNVTNGIALKNGILELTPHLPAGWTHDLHNQAGNLSLADGSVQQLSRSRLREAVASTGVT